MGTSNIAASPAREHLRERQARIERERREELKRKVAVGIGAGIAFAAACLVNAAGLQGYCENMYLL